MPIADRPNRGDKAGAGLNKEKVRKLLDDSNAQMRREGLLRAQREAEREAQREGYSLRQFMGEGRNQGELWDKGWQFGPGGPNADYLDERFPNRNDIAKPWTFDNPGWEYSGERYRDGTADEADRLWADGGTTLYPWEWRELGLDPDDYPGNVNDWFTYPRGSGDKPMPPGFGTNPDAQPPPTGPPPGWEIPGESEPASYARPPTISEDQVDAILGRLLIRRIRGTSKPI